AAAAYARHGLCWLRRSAALGVVAQEGVRRARRQARPPVEKRQLDEEAAAGDLTAERLHELAQRQRRAAGREQVVVHEHAATVLNGVGVQLELVGAVLQFVFRADRLVGQLARLAR